MFYSVPANLFNSIFHSNFFWVKKNCSLNLELLYCLFCLFKVVWKFFVWETISWFCLIWYSLNILFFAKLYILDLLRQYFYISVIFKVWLCSSCWVISYIFWIEFKKLFSIFVIFSVNSCSNICYSILVLKLVSI